MSDTLKPLENTSFEAILESDADIIPIELTVEEIALTINEQGICVEKSLAWTGLVDAVLAKSREGGTYLLEASQDETTLVSRIIQPYGRSHSHRIGASVLKRHKVIVDDDLIIGQELILHGTKHNDDRLKEGSKFVISPIVSALWLPLQTPLQ